MRDALLHLVVLIFVILAKSGKAILGVQVLHWRQELDPLYLMDKKLIQTTKRISQKPLNVKLPGEILLFSNT